MGPFIEARKGIHEVPSNISSNTMKLSSTPGGVRPGKRDHVKVSRLAHWSPQRRQTWALGYLQDKVCFRAEVVKIRQRIGRHSQVRSRDYYEGVPLFAVVAHQRKIDSLMDLKEYIFGGCGSIEPLFQHGGEYIRYTPDSDRWKDSRLRLTEDLQPITFEKDTLKERVYREFVVFVISQPEDLQKHVFPFFEQHKDDLHVEMRHQWEGFKRLVQLTLPKGHVAGDENLRALLEGTQVEEFRRLAALFPHKAEEAILVGDLFHERAMLAKQRDLLREEKEDSELESFLETFLEETSSGEKRAEKILQEEAWKEEEERAARFSLGNRLGLGGKPKTPAPALEEYQDDDVEPWSNPEPSSATKR